MPRWVFLDIWCRTPSRPGSRRLVAQMAQKVVFETRKWHFSGPLSEPENREIALKSSKTGSEKWSKMTVFEPLFGPKIREMRRKSVKKGPKINVKIHEN